MRQTNLLRYLTSLLAALTLELTMADVAFALNNQNTQSSNLQDTAIDNTKDSDSSSVCSLNASTFSPLQTPWFGVEFIDTPTSKITPSHVYMHTKRLQQYVRLMGMDRNAAPLNLYHADIAPRHNFQMAYDLFVLLQLWQQQQGRLRSPIQHTYPDSVEPFHVYQWIDASMALLWCFSDRHQLYSPDMFNVAPVKKLTPADEMVLLVEVMQQVAMQIPDALLESLLFMRLTQMQYLLQDMLLPEADKPVILWRSEGDDRTLEFIFGNVVSHFEALNQLASPVRRIHESINEENRQFVYLLIAGQLFGELLYLNQRHFQLAIPPMISVVALPSDADSLLADAKDVDRLLKSLVSSLEDEI